MSGITWKRKKTVHFSHRGGYLSRLDDEGGKVIYYTFFPLSKIGSRNEDEEIVFIAKKKFIRSDENDDRLAWLLLPGHSGLTSII